VCEHNRAAHASVSKLSFKILLAENYLAYCICQPNEFKQEIKKKLGEVNQGAMVHPGPLLESPLGAEAVGPDPCCFWKCHSERVVAGVGVL